MMSEMSSLATRIDGINGAYAVLAANELVRFRNASALKNIVLHPGDCFNVEYTWRETKDKTAKTVHTLLDVVYRGVSESGHARFLLWNQTERVIPFTRIAVMTRSAFRPDTEAERETVLTRHREIMERRREARG